MVLTTVPQTALTAQAEEASIESIDTDTASEAGDNTASEQITTEGGSPEDTEEPVTVEADAPEATVDAESVAEVVDDDTTVDEEPVVNADDASGIMPMGYADNNAAFAYGTGENVAAESELTVAFTKGVDTDGKLTADVATDGIEFTVEPQSGVTLSKVEAVYGIDTDTPVEDQKVTMTAPAEGATTWTGKIDSSALTDLDSVTGKTVTITITATKEVEAVTHDVTVTAALPEGVTNVADVITVTSVTDSTTEEAVTFDGTTAKISLEEGKTLGLKVALETAYQQGYEVTVKKGEDPITAEGEIYPIAAADNKADVAVTITVTKEVVGEITDLASAKTAVQTAIDKLTFTNADFEDSALTETETKILTAATTALTDSNYTATVKTALAVSNAATEEAPGEATITLEIANSTAGQDSDKDDLALTLTIPVKEPEGEKQTIEQAKKLVEDAVKAADIKVTNEDDTSDDTRKAVADKILAEAQKAKLDENFTVAVKQTTAGTDDKLVITKATEEAAGKAAITLVITDSTADAATKTMDVPIELTIAQLEKTAATLDEVAAAVKAAAEAIGSKTNADVADDTKKEAVAKEILAAAKTAKYDETKFDITRKQTTAGTDDKLEVVNATANANGSAKLTLVVAEKTAEAGKEPQKKEVVITLTVTMQGATTITINDGKAIEQKAGTLKEYTIAADGALDNSVDYDRTVLRAWISGDKLVIRTNAVAETTANVTVYAQGSKEVYGTVAVTVKNFFDATTAAPTVKAGEIQGDAELNVIVSSTVEDYVSGEVGYKVTATAKNQENEDFPEKLAKTKTVYVPRTGDSDEAKITLGEIGDGAKWDYDVTAKLVHGYYRYSMFNELSSSNLSTAVAISTVESKDMTFTSALKLKKEKIAGGNLYTGQSSSKGILIATANFDQIASYKVIGYAVDQYEDCYNDDDEYEGPQWLDLKVTGNEIYVTNVPETARLGKHTITVYASTDRTSGHEAYEARATVVVNVVKGINNLNVVQSSESIYKKDGAKTTFKLTPDFNHDYVGQPDSESTYRSTDGKKWVTAPKSKKVEWSLVGANTSEAVEIANVSVNKANGTVTLEKAYKPDATNNRFRVKVAAADNEDVYGLSEVITVTNAETDISKLVITDSDYKVVAVQTDKKPIPVKAEDIDDGYVYALPANATVGDKGSTLDTTQAFPVENLTIKSNNAKVLSLDGNRIDIKAAGKKVTISVAANDGSKKKNSVTLDLGYSYDEKAGLGLSIYNYSTRKNICEKPAADATEIKTEVTAEYDTPGTADLKVDVWAATAKTAPATGFNYNDAALTNYKLQVKGGKIVKSNVEDNSYSYEIAANAKETILTLTDTSVKSGKKPTYVYKLTNKAYNATDKAPKVKVKNSLYVYSDYDQTVDMSVLDSANKAFGADKKVMVDVDWAAMTTKNEQMLNELSRQIKDTYAPDKDGGITLDIDNDGNDFTAGSYKLRVTVGTESTNQETGVTTFTATTQSATATLKVVKNKKFTFKPTTTYSISKADGAAILTGKSNVNAKQGEKANVSFGELQNIIDKNTGKANKFTHYFTIQHDEQNGTYKLALNREDDLIKEILTGKKDLKTAIDKKDLTGYISYNAWPNVGYYDNDDLYGTVKITVKTVADAAADKPAKFGSKYTASKPEIALTAGSRAWVNIMNGAEYVNVADVALDTRTGKKNSADIDLLGTNDRGQIVLKANKALTNKANHAVNLLVVPESSVYLDDISTAPDDAARQKIFEQYGVPVKVTIKAMEKPALTPHPGTAQETLDDAVYTVTEALNRADGWVQITNDDVANTDKQKEVTQWILDTVERLLDENYMAAVKEGSTLEVVQATKDKEGSAQITLVVTDNSLEATNPNRTMEAAISIPIPKLEGGDTPAPEKKTVTVTVDVTDNISSLSYSIDDGADTPIDSIAASNEIKVESGKALSLKVTAAAGKTVTVTVGGETKEPTGGSYAIGTIDENITVAITTADVTPVTEHTVTVTGTVADIDTLTYSIKDGAQNQSVTLNADTGKATFKVADGKELSLAVTAATGKKVDSVTYGASSTATEENGAYSIGAITADTEITIATSEDSTGV